MAVIVREKVKGSGEWWVFINHKGRRRSKKVGTKKAANSVKREVEARLAKGDLGILKNKTPTVASYGRECVMSPIREWSDATRSAYSSIVENTIIPHLGIKRLDEVKRLDVKRLIESVHHLSSARKRTIVGVLSGIFSCALEDELVEVNPCHRMRRYCGNQTLRDVAPLTSDEVQTLLDNASALPHEVFTFFLMAVRTGLRVGELLALEWNDIDFENRFVEVKKGLNVVTKQVSLPKNKKTRKVDLTYATVQALRRLQAERKVINIGGNEIVFSSLSYQVLKTRIVNEIDPKPIRLHDLGHTYATLRIAKGDNILDVSKQLGHHSVAFTIDKYAHWMSG